MVDAAILAHHSDASLLVTKAGADKRRTITKLKEQLDQSGSIFLGVILNKYDIHLDKYGSYGSYGGYGSYGSYGKNTGKKLKSKGMKE
ncbi:Tyrosine-protein kinase EpsD [Streptococcus gallolyticus]|uniref:Tyrosine-protein kinase EpsD n=1 Tax=Streptococcus gallolyticus TaxID=315405 RepID=A0A139QRD6_9STRE|nr:Tyrosine-protein kinase EpsD [Streptococcus gallolyticus]